MRALRPEAAVRLRGAAVTWPGEKAPQGSLLGWKAAHDLTCWRTHPACALARARDIHLARREHHAAQAHWLGEVLARHARRLPDRDDVAAAILAARTLLEAAHAEVPPNRRKPRPRGATA